MNTTGAALPVLDPARANEMRQVDGGAGKIWARIVAAYLERAPAQLAAFGPLVQAGDLPALALAAHSLKGSSSSLGVSRVAQLCNAIEQAAREQDAGTLAGLLLSLQTEFVAAQEALRADC